MVLSVGYTVAKSTLWSRRSITDAYPRHPPTFIDFDPFEVVSAEVSLFFQSAPPFKFRMTVFIDKLFSIFADRYQFSDLVRTRGTG
jgi:hypothetical protein